MTASAPSGGADLFGHPRGLTVLAATEFWERFSFYGMQSLLLLYMTKYLLLPQHAAGVIGLAAFRSALESLSGPLSDIGFAAQTYGLYNGLIYLLPIAGAWLGDRVLGRTRTVGIGCVLMALGHLAMAVESLFLLALLLLILGSGCLVGNMAAQVGMLYAPGDERHSRAFQIYYVMLNLGALAAPLVVGTLAERIDWHLGFGVAGIGMMIGLITYLAGLRHLPPDRFAAAQPESGPIRLSATQWRRVAIILLLLFGPYLALLIGTEQAYSMMYVWADTRVDRAVFGFQMPVTWIGFVDGVLAIIGVFVAGRIARHLNRRGITWGELARLGTGLMLLVAAWLFAAAIALLPITPLMAWLLFFVMLDFGSAIAAPSVYALVSRLAPPSAVSMLMAASKSVYTLCYFALGWLGQFYEPIGPSGFWLLTAAIMAAGALLLLLPFGWWNRKLGAQAPTAAL